MPALFAVTLFLSATLLFLIQPMIAKMLMPLAGGTAAVWSTCMVFFQAALLGGYWYAHAGPKRMGARGFAKPHAFLLLLPLAALAVSAYFGSPLTPIKSLAPRGEDYPFFNLVLLLGALVGLPFFFLATSAPLLQRWFAETDSPYASDPYFLYAASNLGSLLGLVAYPAFVERYLPLKQQAWLFAGGFALWVVLIWICAKAIAASQPKAHVEAAAGPPIPLAERLRWMILAAVPSSLMLSVTSFATVDLAPIPLFIVVPLGVYLLTFVIAFARPGEWLSKVMGLAAPVALLLLVFMQVSDTKPKNLMLGLGIHVGVFFVTALACHVELARRRPPAGRLTEFWLWVSFGGVVGGMFNALVAPVIFKEHSEYILGLIMACFLVPRGVAARCEGQPVSLFFDVAIPVIVGCAVFLAVRFWNVSLSASIGSLKDVTHVTGIRDWLQEHKFAVNEEQIKTILCYGIPILIVFAFVERPLRFGLSVAAICFAATANLYQLESTDAFPFVKVSSPDDVKLRSRSFFGVLKVTQEPSHPAAIENMYYRLVHGTTLHGMQRREVVADQATDLMHWMFNNQSEAQAYYEDIWTKAGSPEAARKILQEEPLTYYHRRGPAGEVFSLTPAGQSNKPVAFIGFGTGSLCAYAKPEQAVTIYEIDPAVRRISTNPEYFSYYSAAEKRGAKLNMIMGDARLRIEEAAPNTFAVIAVDAFSSDSIPIHLLTKEAIQLYFSKLAPDGVLALHVSNRYLELDKIVARLAEDLGKSAYQWKDQDEWSDGNCAVKSRSNWIVLVNKPEHAGVLLKGTKVEEEGIKWGKMTADPAVPLWTDDFSNILSVMSWKE
ncbi:MAG: spermidine synthase [Gemmataceae bacterium]